MNLSTICCIDSDAVCSVGPLVVSEYVVVVVLCGRCALLSSISFSSSESTDFDVLLLRRALPLVFVVVVVVVVVRVTLDVSEEKTKTVRILWVIWDGEGGGRSQNLEAHRR